MFVCPEYWNVNYFNTIHIHAKLGKPANGWPNGMLSPPPINNWEISELGDNYIKWYLNKIINDVDINDLHYGPDYTFKQI